MKKLLLIFYLMSFCTLSLQSQNFTISGKVVDADTKDPLEYATVTFIPKNNQEYIGSITNSKGKFEITVPKGKYTVVVEYLAYKTITFKSQNITNNQHYGSIELSEEAEIIDNVEIKVEKKNIEIKPKKMVYNVTKDIASEGVMITDILNNIPSVTISDGVASIRGQITTVMINGKASSLSKSDVLKSLPAGTVEKIEVIPNPGAQYNAEYKSILNIIIKKGKNKGLNASITGSLGYKDIYGGLVTVNNKTEKVNFYTNVSFSHKNVIKVSEAKNEYFFGGVTSSFLNEDSKFDSNNKGLISSVGADYYISKNTTLSGSVNYTNLDYKDNTLTNTSFLDASSIETDYNERSHKGRFDNEAFEFTTEIEHKFKKEGRKLTSYVKYLYDSESNNTTVLNSNTNFTDEAYTQTNKLTNTTFDIKYKTPITKKTVLTIGYNGDFGKIPFRNSTISKNIDYLQDVHGVFADYEYETEKFYIGAGVRGEFANTTVDYLNLNVLQERNENDIFPSLYSQYAISDSKIIIVSYDKGVKRPDYTRLQPFEEKFSETLSYVGNESLKSMYSDSYGITYNYYGEKFTVIPSLFYQKLNDYWQDVTYKTGEQINGVNKLITSPQNVGFSEIYGLNFTTLYKASNALNFTFNTNLYNFDQHGVFNTTNLLNQPISIDYNQQSFSGDFSLSTQIKFPDIINIQTNIFHYLKSEGPVSTRKAYTYGSLSMSKKILKKKATLSLSINDVFNSKQTDRDRFGADYFSNSVIKNKYSDIILSFTYRFNNSKSNKKIDFNKKDRKPNY